MINLLPTGIGWLAALIAALMLPRREPVHRRCRTRTVRRATVATDPTPSAPEGRHDPHAQPAATEFMSACSCGGGGAFDQAFQ